MFGCGWKKVVGSIAVAGALLLGDMATLTPSGIGFGASASAQTQGMQRREDRRGTRQQSRSVKHDCNASGQASRSQCRQAKRTVKQEGRQRRVSGQ